MLPVLSELVGLPPMLAWPLSLLVVYRWGVIPAVRGTLGMLGDVRRYRDETAARRLSAGD